MLLSLANKKIKDFDRRYVFQNEIWIIKLLPGKLRASCIFIYNRYRNHWILNNVTSSENIIMRKNRLRVFEKLLMLKKLLKRKSQKILLTGHWANACWKGKPLNILSGSNIFLRFYTVITFKIRRMLKLKFSYHAFYFTINLNWGFSTFKSIHYFTKFFSKFHNSYQNYVNIFVKITRMYCVA